MAETVPDSGAPRAPRAAWSFAILLALSALGISAYLSYTSIVTGQSPAGCGSGSGCAEVLASKWSRLAGVPVSVLAMLVYVVVLAVLPGVGAPSQSANKHARSILSLCAASIIAAALWFTYLQLFVLKAICPYCMADHALGLLLAGLLIVFLRARQPVALGVGLAGAALLIVLQVNSTTVVTTLDAPTPGTDSDTTSAGSRTVTVLDGQLKLDLNNEPRLGEPDAERVLVMMYDYACPHCRHTHSVIEQVMQDRPGRLAVVLLPTPLNRQCNPHAPQQMHERFDESCELARIALAVFLADRSAFTAFDHWMYEPQTPRTSEQARAEAVRRVGQNKFEQAFSDPRMQQMIARNVYAYGRSGADRVPVLVSPGRPASVGRVDDAGLLIRLLEQTPTGDSQ